MYNLTIPVNSSGSRTCSFWYKEAFTRHSSSECCESAELTYLLVSAILTQGAGILVAQQLSGWGQSQEKMVSEAFRSLPLLYYMRTSDSSEVWATCCSLLYWIKSVTHRVLNLGLHLLWKCRVWSLPLQSVRRCKHSDSHCSIPGLHWMQHPLQPNPHSWAPSLFSNQPIRKKWPQKSRSIPKPWTTQCFHMLLGWF